MTADLILRTRLHVLRRNLEEVKGVIDSVDGVRQGLQRLLDNWRDDGPRDTLRQVVSKLEGLAESQGLSTQQREALSDAGKTLDTMRSQMFSTTTDEAVHAISLRSLDLRQSELKRTLEDFLVYQANRHLRTLAKIEDDLKDALAEPDMDASHAAALEVAWVKYLEVLPEARAVFAEYVDFLAGFAVRYAGYDSGVCRLADELVTAIRLRDFSWNSITIPARREALDVTMARIIRMGFPEWSLWALPLAAYGLGSVLVSTVDEFVKYAKVLAEARRPLDPPEPGPAELAGESGAATRADEETRLNARLLEAKVLLADAFATYVMGPAYPCALILLRLDPRAPEEPREVGLVRLRAETVLCMLVRMSKEVESGPYAEVERELRGPWGAAVSQSPYAHDNDQEVQDFPVNDLVDFVAGQLSGRELGDEAWPRLSQWKAAFLDGREPTEDQIDYFDDGLRHVLNAAWLARLDAPIDADLEGISELARGLWDSMLVRAPERASTTGPRGPISPRNR